MSDVRTETGGSAQDPLRGPERRGRVSLPANRAFVIQFRADGAERGSFAGRLEHVTTGRVQPFESSSELVAGLTRVLAEIDALAGHPRDGSSAGRSLNPKNQVRHTNED